MLLVDRPPSDKLRSHMKILLVWVVLEAFAVVAMANRVSTACTAASAHCCQALPGPARPCQDGWAGG